MNYRELSQNNPFKPAAASNDDGYSCVPGTPKFYALCAVGGAISCGLTHTMITPLDLVKCRMQVDKAKYPNSGTGFKVTLAEDGVRGLVKGWAPTMIGYSFQGIGKFGFYEVFKMLYGGAMGEENAYTYRLWLYLGASASAEFFADMFLSPFEAMKVRIQTMPGYANNLRQAYGKMSKEAGSPFFGGVKALWMRQIPYTMMKFAAFEKVLEALYQYVVPKPRAECSKGEQLVVTFAAGYIAGILCAIVSHPADCAVSVMNKTPGSTFGGTIKSLGWSGCWQGLGPRIIMIGTLTGLQWFIYDSVKVALRIPRPPPPSPPASLVAKWKAQGLDASGN